MKHCKLVVGFLVVFCASALAAAQTHEKPVSKAILDGITAKSGQVGPFLLLTPDDLKGELLKIAGDPCNQAAPIGFGQTINGSLTSSDCRLDDNSYADFYTFSGTQGQQVTINLSSGAFDTYLGLANESGTFVVEDDDGGGGTNSRIVATLPASGT
jgi:hypothetical protein